MTKAEVIANAIAQNASEEDIAVLENTSDDLFEINIEEEETDVTKEDVTVVPESITPEKTKEDIKSALLPLKEKNLQNSYLY